MAHKQFLSEELKKHQFRVTIFGSARIKENDNVYKQTYKLAKEIGALGIDVVTGGGPGIMEAASKGHESGDKNDVADSIGLVIKLPWETKKNKYLEVKKTFSQFSKRLDTFIALSSAVVIMEGGVGTCLEFLYTWQLTQVHHIAPIPIILLGKMWGNFIKWVKKYQLKTGLVSPENMLNVYPVKNIQQAMKIIKTNYETYEKDPPKDYKYNK